MKFRAKKLIAYILGVIYCLLIFVAIIIVITILPLKNNLKIYSVMSGSMEPTISVGSLILTKPQAAYSVGDIISFQNDEQIATKNTTTHRIAAIEEENGLNYYSTKGDANDSNDPGRVNDNRIKGKVVLSIPLLGYLISYIKTLPGLMLLVIIPAVIIVYEEFRKIHAETNYIIRTHREKKSGRQKVSEQNNGIEAELLAKEKND